VWFSMRLLIVKREKVRPSCIGASAEPVGFVASRSNYMPIILRIVKTRIMKNQSYSTESGTAQSTVDCLNSSRISEPRTTER
jgi:hypothetical protein